MTEGGVFSFLLDGAARIVDYKWKIVARSQKPYEPEVIILLCVKCNAPQNYPQIILVPENIRIDFYDTLAE